MTRRVLATALLSLLTASTLFADVSILERKVGHRKVNKPGGATGSQGLIDAQGLKYFINTNITFSTTSSASGAMSEASFTHAVHATTLNGGTTSSTLNDAFDGYQSICLSLNNTVAQCETGNANFVIYNKNGPPTTECLGSVSGVNRQVVFPVQTSGNVQMFRKVFVPDNDQFGRWLNYFTNTGATPQTVTMVTANNLGSDSLTTIVDTSSGTPTISPTDTWITSFQNYSGTTSSDVRLGHVLQGNAPVSTPVSGIFFVNGNDNPFWGYTFTLNPGETKIIMNFVTGQPSNAASAAKAAQLVSLPANALQCMTLAEQQEVVNFAAAPFVATVPTLSAAGLVGLGVLLGVVALFLLRRRAAALPG